jgi:phage tail protein X
MWQINLLSRQLVRLDIAQDSAVSGARIVASRAGCATPATDTTMLVLDKSGRAITTRLVLPQGMGKFDWRDISYDDAQDVYLVTGATGYAVIPASRVPDSVRVKVVSGKVSEGSIANTDFSNFLCCARLGGDGKTLFSVANLGDKDMNGYTGLAAIDVSTGQYKRMYLPVSPVWQQTGRFELAGSTNARLWSQGGGSQLMLRGFADNVQSVLTVDIKSGKVQALPERKDETFYGITPSGRYTLWRDRDDQTMAVDALSQKVVGQHAGIVLAVAHAQSGDARVTLAETGPQDILVFRPDSDWIKRVGIAAYLPKYTGLMQRARSLRELRSIMLGGIDYPDPKTRRLLYIEHSEVITYAQSLPLPKPELTMPALNPSVSEEDEQAWREYAAACDSYSRAQGEASDLALLQCLVAPW